MEKTKKFHEKFMKIIHKSGFFGGSDKVLAPKSRKQKDLKRTSSLLLWRRVRDLNPRTAHHRYTISSRAPSTTQPTLHMVAEEGFEPSQTESESVVLPLHNSAILVAEEGFEPSQTESESVVLPLHNSAMSFVVCRFLRTNEYYYTHVGVECQEKIQKIL